MSSPDEDIGNEILKGGCLAILGVCAALGTIIFIIATLIKVWTHG